MNWEWFSKIELRLKGYGWMDGRVTTEEFIDALQKHGMNPMQMAVAMEYLRERYKLDYRRT
jgi:hypothetical protein